MSVYDTKLMLNVEVTLYKFYGESAGPKYINTQFECGALHN